LGKSRKSLADDWEPMKGRKNREKRPTIEHRQCRNVRKILYFIFRETKMQFFHLLCVNVVIRFYEIICVIWTESVKSFQVSAFLSDRLLHTFFYLSDVKITVPRKICGRCPWGRNKAFRIFIRLL
jgi:hypothetical protein